mgnify:CR=1 FL=1
MEHDNFKSFCSWMYEECKMERRHHGEKEITRDDYVRRNNSLLLELYAKQDTNKTRETMDEQGS